MTEQKPEGPAISQGEKYFNARMPKYGISNVKDPVNQVQLYVADTDKPGIVNKLVDFPVFSPVEAGIKIIVYTLDRTLIKYKGNDSRWSKDFYITRLHTPIIHQKTGKEMKYQLPSGAGTYPFFPPQLIEKYEKKEKIKNLILSEGYLKIWPAAMKGWDIVGLSSITHYKDKVTGGLHSDIIKLMRDCQVENIIWLADGDANRISLSALEKGEDIYNRPNGFFSSCASIKRLLSDYTVNVHFAYINSKEIDGVPKGLDDMLIAAPEKADDYLTDLTSFSKDAKYFWRSEMTYSLGKIQRHFRLHDVNQFVEFHNDEIKEIGKLEGKPEKDIIELKKKEFVWCGTRYKWNDDKNVCEVLRPGDAQKYLRVGDDYFEILLVPNKYKDIETGQHLVDRQLHGRKKQTIIDDYTKDFVQHIPKYKAFCNVPDHVNYQQVIHNCYNRYHPFTHEPEEGEYGATLKFLEHIFGSGSVTVQHPTKGKITISELDLGLDYVQLLYQQPQQVLPILCLVSKANETGKSTFGRWLRHIFTQNVAIVGNAELANEFNSSWSSKLLVICDEAKIDKQVVVERVKSMSTADKIFSQAKGKDHVDQDFFGKFLFFSNNEENFIYASEDDRRYWVRKVPVIKELFIGLETEMKNEIPAFLHFLNKRKLKTENLDRAWFYHELIKTDALKKVIAFSRSTVEKELRAHLRDMFFDHGVSRILMSVDNINETFFRKKYEKNYLRHVIEEQLKADMYHTWVYKEVEHHVLDAARIAFETSNKDRPKQEQEDFSAVVKKRYKTKRYAFPRASFKQEGSGQKLVTEMVTCNGRPYVFDLEKFLTKDEIENAWANVDPDTRQEARMIDAENEPKPWNTATVPVPSSNGHSSDELPF